MYFFKKHIKLHLILHWFFDLLIYLVYVESGSAPNNPSESHIKIPRKTQSNQKTFNNLPSCWHTNMFKLIRHTIYIKVWWRYNTSDMNSRQLCMKILKYNLGLLHNFQSHLAYPYILMWFLIKHILWKFGKANVSPNTNVVLWYYFQT